LLRLDSFSRVVLDQALSWPGFLKEVSWDCEVVFSFFLKSQSSNFFGTFFGLPVFWAPSTISCCYHFPEWSAPSAIGTGGVGVGGQIGGELTDFVIILNTKDAVKAFSMGGNVTLGGNLSVAVGPVGRNAEAAAAVGHIAAIYSYSKTKGLFAGISVEGSVIIERKDANEKFYGRKISAKDLLLGVAPQPAEAEPLYEALSRRATKVDHVMSTSSFEPSPAAKAAASGSGSSYSSSSTTPSSYHSAAPGAPVIPARPGASGPRPKTAIALFDFPGQRADDLAFKKGDIIVVTRQTESQNDWWEGDCNGRHGSFPANFVKVSWRFPFRQMPRITWRLTCSFQTSFTQLD
jgi:hypothetical protein